MSTTNTVTDRHGKEWDLTFTLLSARNLDKADFGQLMPEAFSFTSISESILRKIVMDNGVLLFTIFVMCQKQMIKNLDIDPSESKEKWTEAEELFIDSFHGPAIEVARGILMETLGDFFQDHKTALSMLQAQTKAGRAAVAAELEKMGPEVEKKVVEMVKKETSSLKSQLMRTLDQAVGERSTE